jgi:hypothetical protein
MDTAIEKTNERYNAVAMEPEVVCKPTAKYDMPVEGDKEKRLLIGFNMVNPLEILYNELDDGRINVFHAMPCRIYRSFE